MAAPHWRTPLRALLLAAVTCVALGVGVYFWSRRSSSSGGGGGGGIAGPPVPPDADTAPGSTPPFFWELPPELPGAVAPHLCEWGLTADELVALGPTPRRADSERVRTPDGRLILWRGRFSVSQGWCSFAARVDGNYTQQPQIQFVDDPTPPPPPAPPPPWPPPFPPPPPPPPRPPNPPPRPGALAVGPSTNAQTPLAHKCLQAASRQLPAGRALQQGQQVQQGQQGQSSAQVGPRAGAPPPPAVLLMTYPAGGFSSESGMNLRVFPFNDGIIGASATLSYQVYFPPAFDFHKGGKLPGLRQGDACSGGRFEDTCFSARLNWVEEGAAQGYLYVPLARQVPAFWELPNTFHKGSAGIIVGRGAGGVHFFRGAWNDVALRLQLNDPGLANGLFEFSVNGVVGISFNQMYWRGSPGQLVDHIMMQSFFGGNDSSWAPATAQRTLFRRFMLTT